MFLLFFYLFLALFVSFTCSIMESVLLSTPQSFLLVKLKTGKSWAQAFYNFKQNIDKPLSAILSLNTVAHTIGAAGVGAQAVKVFGETYFGIVSAILTLLILIITEIIPKTIGASYWRGMARFTTTLLKITVFIAYPLVVMSSLLTRLIAKESQEQSISREELSALAGIGADEGVFTEKEYKIIHSLLRLKNVKVTDVMTPRVVVTVANEKMSLSEFAKSMGHLYFSRIPVYAGKDENITGYILRQDVFEKLSGDSSETMQLLDIKRDIVVVPNTMPMFGIWEKLLYEQEHIALVVDQYGGMDGIITMEDIIETILGLEIVDEKDTVADMQQYAKERWKARQVKYRMFGDGKPE